MSSYDPDPGASPNNLTFLALLTQRDLAGQVPINYVNHPGVVLSAACFGNNQFIRNETARCFSNLLASHFRIFHIDLYWDTTRHGWSLCPVQLNAATAQAAATSSSATRAMSTISSLSNVGIGRQALSTSASHAVASDVPEVEAARQGKRSATSQHSPATTTRIEFFDKDASSISATATTSQLPQETPVQVGPYVCSPESTLGLLLDVLYGHFTSTNTDVNATLVQLSLNIHAAASASNPTGSALQPSSQDLPSNSSLLSRVFSDMIGSLLYTPDQLATERANFYSAGGWAEVQESDQPYSYYFTVNDDNGRPSSPDGWPGEAFIQLTAYKRMTVEINRVDPQMSSYDFSADSSIIFPLDYTSTERNVSIAKNGSIAAGCFFNPTQTNLTQVNSSWALTGVGKSVGSSQTDLGSVYEEAINLMDCGISPILNTTLNGVSANQNYVPYQAYVQTTIWSWSTSQPGNATTSPLTNGDRCATMNSSTGNWQVANCGSFFAGACRVNNEPYQWQISSPATMYYKVDDACPDGTNFDVPRTALENAYLLSVFRDYLGGDAAATGSLLYLDLNDLDIPTCWVSGFNTTCPYRNEPPPGQQREYVVPAVAGAIVLVLTILTLLVKCAGNRRMSKRRRRGDNGWDYEGVPA